jgi:hypothetical protein
MKPATPPLSLYQKMIVELFDCPMEEVHIIEDLMRNEVLHSTLDWLSRDQFHTAAREAKSIFDNDREFFLEAYAERRRFFLEMKAQSEATANTATYEI